MSLTTGSTGTPTWPMTTATSRVPAMPPSEKLPILKLPIQYPAATDRNSDAIGIFWEKVCKSSIMNLPIRIRLRRIENED